MANTPFFYREEKNHTYYHDIKIFIFGTDVTPWITSQVALHRVDRDGISSLSFNLSNQYRAFEITGENIGMEDPNTFLNNLGDPKTKNSNGQVVSGSKFRLTDPYSIYGKYSELAKAKIYSLKKQVSGSKRNIKFEVQALGPSIGGTGARLKNISNENSNKATSDVTDRYPMNIGSLVFHKYDPVRFFVKNPLSSGDDEWTCEFTGYLDTKPFSQNYINGESIINITCQDIRILMSHMRVQMNPSSQVGSENLAFFGKPGAVYSKTDPIPLDSGLFNDFIVHGSKTHVLGEMTWKGSMDFLLFGAPTSGGGRRGGIGKLKKGLTYSFDPADSKRFDVLEKWNNLIVFGSSPIAVKEDVAPLVPEGSLEADPNKFEMMPSSAASGSMAPGTFLTKSQMYALGSSTVPDQPGSPEAAKVHYLLPAAGTPLHNCIEYDVWQSIDTRVEFQTRLELLNQLCKNIDYQMYVSGMGDIIVEFPMYDFQPTDYNETYNNLYTFTDHLVSDNMNDEGGSAISALQVTSRPLQRYIQQGNPEIEGTTPIGNDQARIQTIFSSVLASRIGPILETYDIPGVSQDRLVQLGYIEFNKRLANFNKFDMAVVYRPYVGLNRPIYHLRKQRFGISSSVAYTWRILEDAALEISLLYTRKREGNTFRFITGGERQPISYRTIFDGLKAPGMGVSDDLEKGDKPVKINNVDNAVDTASKEANRNG